METLKQLGHWRAAKENKKKKKTSAKIVYPSQTNEEKESSVEICKTDKSLNNNITCLGKVKSFGHVRILTSKDDMRIAKERQPVKICVFCHKHVRKICYGNHLKIHHEHRCTICHKTFSSKVEKQQHHASSHVDKMYHCVVCQREFLTIGTLHRHLRSKSHLQCCQAQHRVVDMVTKACQPLQQQPESHLTQGLQALQNEKDPINIKSAREDQTGSVGEVVVQAGNSYENQLNLFYKQHPELQQLLDMVDKLVGPDSFLRTEVEGKIKHFYFQNPEILSMLSNLQETVSKNKSCIQQTEVLAITNTISGINQSDYSAIQNDTWQYQTSSSNQIRTEASSVGWLSMAVQTLNDQSFGCTPDIQTTNNTNANEIPFSFCEMLKSGNDLVVNGEGIEFCNFPSTLEFDNQIQEAESESLIPVSTCAAPVDPGYSFNSNSQTDLPAMTSSDSARNGINTENTFLSTLNLGENSTSPPQDAESIRRELDMLLTDIANDFKNSM
ncbi:hypothetical protein ScPMuIL_000786 [Solemya velum]